MTNFFYKPNDAWSADFIPLYANGRFYLYYLLDWRDWTGHGEGTPWYLLTTEDFVHFTEHGCMLARGSETEQDLYVFTGSALEAEERYHIYYTGHNPHLRAAGKPEQAVMHATSTDLLAWEKHPEDTFFAPASGYEPHDWRDPFVFWNEENAEYWMLLAARRQIGPQRQRGCTALCTSSDLRNWRLQEPLWAPNLYFTHECPDLFRIGDWWYLIFSEFSDSTLTRYRMSRSLSGPWIAPADDAFDGRAFYAAKSASNGDRRLLFGWNPTREGDSDEGRWQWGGNLVVHELVQEADGCLSVKAPQEVVNAFGVPHAVEPAPQIGHWEIEGDKLSANAEDGFAWCRLGAMPETCRIDVTISYASGTTAFGLVTRADSDLNAYYQIRVEPNRQRVVFDCWPRPGDQPFILERSLNSHPGTPVRMQVFADGTIFEIYVNEKIALSSRGYAHADGDWGVFVVQGEANFSNLSLAVVGAAVN